MRFPVLVSRRLAFPNKEMKNQQKINIMRFLRLIFNMDMWQNSAEEKSSSTVQRKVHWL
jgi:hypothetical protein